MSAMAKVKSLSKPAAAQVEPATRRGEERRAALLRAAREVFLEKGYAGTSVEAVMARVGGGSKASLYSYFGNKDGLFENIIRLQCDEFLANLAIPRDPGPDIERDLLQFAQRAFRLFTDPQRIAMLRVMMGEAVRFPQLAELLYANGPRRGLAMLAEFLRRAHDQRQLDCPHPEIAAIHFMEMIKAHAQYRALLGLPLFADGLDADGYLRDTVQTFLHGRLRRPADTALARGARR